MRELHLINAAESNIDAVMYGGDLSLLEQPDQLSDRGVEQAKRINSYLRRNLGAIPLEASVAPSILTIRTAHYAMTPNDAPGIDLRFDSRLAEQGHQTPWESVRATRRRVMDFANSSSFNSPRVAFTHESAIRAIIQKSSKLPFGSAQELEIPTASDTILVWQDGEWAVRPENIGISTS